MIEILFGLQLCSTKYWCFLWKWVSSETTNDSAKIDAPKLVLENNVELVQLVEHKIYFRYHTKVALIRNLVKAMVKLVKDNYIWKRRFLILVILKSRREFTSDHGCGTLSWNKNRIQEKKQTGNISKMWIKIVLITIILETRKVWLTRFWRPIEHKEVTCQLKPFFFVGSHLYFFLN